MIVGINGRYSFTRVRNNNDLRSLGAGVTIETLKSWGFEGDQIWLVRDRLTVFVDGVRYIFTTPHLTDLASVPKFLRGAIDNDDLRLIAPALVHDYNFATHALSFKASNMLFRRMIKAMGGSAFKAWLCWVAVSTPIGKRRYNKKSEKLAEYYKETCEVIE